MEVTLRALDNRDLPLLLAWAQISQVWEYLPTSRRDELLTWEKHNEWFHYQREWRFDWVIVVNDPDNYWQPRPVGVVHVTNLNEEVPEIGLYIAEVPLWGKGIGRQALEKAIWQIKAYKGEKLCAVVHPLNGRSIRLFESLGFKRANATRRQYRYELELESTPG